MFSLIGEKEPLHWGLYHCGDINNCNHYGYPYCTCEASCNKKGWTCCEKRDFNNGWGCLKVYRNEKVHEWSSSIIWGDPSKVWFSAEDKSD
jgi:hypothetical protein